MLTNMMLPPSPSRIRPTFDLCPVIRASWPSALSRMSATTQSAIPHTLSVKSR